MADLFDRYGVDAGSTPAPDLFDRYKPQGPSAGGVQDYEPIQTRHIGLTELPKDEAAGWATTRIKKGLTGVAGMPRALSDLVDYAGEQAKLPEYARRAIQFANPITMAGQFMPSTGEMRDVIDPVLPSVNADGRLGKAVDLGVESAVGSLALGGGAASIFPSFAGGATSEVAGQVAKGGKWEPAARVLGGVLGGTAAAFGQNALQSIWQGLRNLKPDVDETSAKILSKAIQRDKTTPNQLAARQAELGPGATIAEAGGPNVRGTVRGAIAAPGEARTNVLNAFESRISQVDDQATAALNKNISRNNSLATSVDDLAAQRQAAATPAYQGAGIPDRPRMVSPERTVRFAMDEPPATIPAEYNTPIFSSQKLDALIRDSADVRAAIGAARRLPDYKNLPTNSMSMLDKAYKHLNGLEQEARRAGNGTRVHDLQNLRRDFREALTDVNPRYGRALEAFEGPSKLIDAAGRGKEWFSKNVDPATVRKEFAAMSPDDQQAALIGVRDWARDVAGRSDRGIIAERVWSSDNNRQRFQAILETPGFEDLARTMEGSKNAIRTARDISVGSRTAPMLAEQADNTGQMNVLSDLAQGRPVSAAGNWLRGTVDRLATGRNEAVNARLAEIATMTDPAQVGLVAALANRAALEQAARASGRGNALLYGATAPGINAMSGERR